MPACSFEVDSRCPGKLVYIYDFSASAVNSVVICTGMKWEDVVRSLIDQALIRAYMPTYITCVTDMIRVNGFASRPKIKCVSDLPEISGKSGEKNVYIVRIKYMGYCAVVPNASGSGYVMKGLRSFSTRSSREFDACWQYVPGTDNRTGLKRDGFAMPGRTEPHKRLAVKNMNPKDHNIGDCSVRALCAALECTWDEAIDLLVRASRYINPFINSTANINNALIRLDFERHKAMRRDGRLLTGKEFCELMTYTFHNGERIFAYVGRSHCAAILPFTDPDGSVRYKTQDTWDSTDRKIGDYWVIPPKEKRLRAAERDRPKKLVEGEIRVGSSITHREFGRGVIVEEKNGFLTVDFENVGTKKLSKTWVLNSVGRE